MRTEDSHLAKQQEMARPDQAPAGEFDDARLPDSYPPVATRAIAPALGGFATVALSAANPVRPLLPQDPHRRIAWVLAVDNPVVICTTLELAQQAAADGATTVAGSVIPAGQGFPVYCRSACWVAATTIASASRVSVHSARDDD